MGEREKLKMQCPECEETLISPEPGGELVCPECGTVKKRPTGISVSFRDWTPEWFSNWNEDDSDTLKEWLTTLRTASCQLNLSTFPFREEAARIIRAKRNELLRSQKFGKNKRVAIAALIYLVLREYGKMRPMKEICKTLNVDYRLAFKYEWDMRSILSMNGSFTAKEHLMACGPRLTNEKSYLQAAEYLLDCIQKRLGGHPASLAAGALYFVCKNKGEKISKEEIGSAFNVSGRTVYSSQSRISKIISTQATIREL